MSVVGSNRLEDAALLPLGERSQATPNGDFTVDATEPFPSGLGLGVGELRRPAYWLFKAATTSWIAVDTKSTTSNPRDTFIAIWWFDPVTSDYELVAYDDNGGGSSTSLVTFKAGAGATYVIQVWAKTTNATDISYIVRTSVSASSVFFNSTVQVTAPGSDTFAGAVTIVPGQAVNTFTNTGYTVEAGEPTDLYRSTTIDTKSCWWKMTPTTSGLMTLSAQGMLSVFTGSSLATLEMVDMRHNNSSTVLLVLEVVKGTTYYIRWSPASFTGTTTTFQTTEVLPVHKVSIGLLNPRRQVFSDGSFAAGSFTVVGGSTALSDNSDGTYALVTHSNGLTGSPPLSAYVVDPVPTPINGGLADIKLRMRACNDAAPADGGEGAYFNYLTAPTQSSAFYSPFNWRWKPTTLLDRKISLRNANGQLQVSASMLATGSWPTQSDEFPDHYPPYGWGYQQTQLQGDHGFNYPPATFATVTEAWIDVYIYDDQAAVKPPDIDFFDANLSAAVDRILNHFQGAYTS